MSQPAPIPMGDLVRADLFRYAADVSIKAFCRHYLSTPGFKYTVWMRLAKGLRARSVLFRPCYYFCRLLLRHLAVKYGISIPYNTTIGPGLYIGHYGGIVVNDQVTIGNDCNINHGVTIGVKYGGKSPGVPVLGDRIFLGPGSVVIGGIRLGNDVAVGANAVVLESVEESGVVAGIPGRVVSFGGSSHYVVNTARDR
jgi:serine O-acetyltransferase